jgi:hypothetical protein
LPCTNCDLILTADIITIMGEGGWEAEGADTWWDGVNKGLIPPSLNSFSLMPSFSHDGGWKVHVSEGSSLSFTYSSLLFLHILSCLNNTGMHRHSNA